MMNWQVKRGLLKRHPENPIVVPGGYDWRAVTTFNPGAMYDEGKYWLYERAAGHLRPFICHIGLMSSEDGVHFTHVVDRPVFTSEMCGSKYGSCQDARVVKIDDTYYMTFAYRPYAWSMHPTGVGAPDTHETEHPDVKRLKPQPGDPKNVIGGYPDNMTRSGLAVSKDRVNWKLHSWITPDTLDDRDVILFPEKINGRYVVFRRPAQWVGPQYGNTKGPSMWISFSDDLAGWSEPQLLIKGEYTWEDNKVGGAIPPIKTDAGWLVFYHGVETIDKKKRALTYRVGVMMLDLKDPTKVVARCPDPIMEPETYYERFGLYIPNVIFPTGNVVVDGVIKLYYGCCDSCIALAECRLDEMVESVMKWKT